MSQKSVGGFASGAGLVTPGRRNKWLQGPRACPAGVTALMTLNGEIDVRNILPAIRAPTLLLHSVRDAVIDIGVSRFMAERIPGARLVELAGPDHLLWLSDADAILGEIEEFLTGVRRSAESDRVRDCPLHRYRRRNRKGRCPRRSSMARSARQPP